MATTALSVPTSLSEVKRRLMDAERTKTALAKVKKKGAEMAESLITTAEVGMAALVIGGIHGRFGDLAPAKVPLALGAGILLHAAGWSGLAGKQSKHLNNLGNGALAAYLTTVGVSLGADLRRKALGATASGMAGDVYGGPRFGGGVLSDSEMDRAARAA